MKITKDQQLEILNDIINLIEQCKDEPSPEDYPNIDCLREEIEDQPDMFNYNLDQFNQIINALI